MSQTTSSNVFIPQVCKDMVEERLPKALRVTPFCRIDDTLIGIPGDTVTVPYWNYVGDAGDHVEGTADTPKQMTTGKAEYKVKMASIAIQLTDEAASRGAGNPAETAARQVTKALAQKIDADAINAAYQSPNEYVDTTNKIKYANIIEAIDVFEEEYNSEKVMFIHPLQVGTLRKDSDFISRDKYGNQVMVDGEIGMIANCRIVPSKRVAKNATFYSFCKSTDTGALKVVEANPAESGEVLLATVKATLPAAKADDYVLLNSTAAYFCPIIKLDGDAEVDGEEPAITIFRKSNVRVESQRNVLAKYEDISGDLQYVAGLTDATKVVVAKIKA